VLKTLIVEDNGDKLRKILQTLADVDSFDLDLVERVASINEAREKLRRTGYDLLILDIALPLRLDQEAVADGGIQLLNEMSARPGYKTPTHIIGITAYPGLLAGAQHQFSEKLLTVIQYDDTSDQWMVRLQERTRHMIAAKADLKSEPDVHQSHIAVLCALRSPELDAVLRIGWGWEQTHLIGDDTVYFRGEFEREGRRQIVWAAEAPRMGMPAATVIAMKMIFQFRPEYIAMAGITAGMPGRTKFGDILAADPAYDWGSGKWSQDADGKLQFEPSAHQLPLSTPLRNKLKALAVEKGVFSKIRDDWPAEVPDHSLVLHTGPVASGASVLADGSTAEQIMSRQRNLIGIEMETYGLFVAADEAPAPKPSVFSIKSVVDFASGDKNDRFQKYAAYTSAQTLKHFAENYL